MKTLFSVAAVLTALLGVLWLFFPQLALTAWGVSHPDAVAVYMGRRYGAMFFGYTVMLWLGRTSTPSPALSAMLAGGASVTAMVGVVSFVGAMTGAVGPAVWGAFVVEVVLAAAFIFYYARTR